MLRHSTLLVVVALFVVQAVIRFGSHFSLDTAWYIVVAQGLLEGKKLYVDFIEVNPPLGMWLAVPPVWLADKLGLGVIPVFYAYVFALVAASVAMVRRYVQGPDQGWITLAAATALLFLPAGDFTQREHFTAIMVLPWLMLRIFEPAGIGRSERFLAGAVAGLGIAIKPYCIFMPVLVEAFLLWERRDWRSTLAAENIGGTLAVIVYVGLAALFTPEYFRSIIALGRVGYLPYYGYPTPVVFLNFGWAALFGGLALLGWRDRKARLIWAAALGFALAYFAQFKGFTYHALPALVMAFIACVAAVASSQSRRDLILVAAASVAFLAMVSQRVNPATRLAEVLGGVDLSARPSLFLASNRMADGFPFALENQLRWSSRYPTQWLAAYAADHWQKDKPVDDPTVKFILDTELDDFLNNRPDIVVIDDSAEEVARLGGQFHFLDFWNADPRFAGFWQDYKLKSSTGGWLVYTRQ